jgi:hypothetical protein
MLAVAKLFIVKMRTQLGLRNVVCCLRENCPQRAFRDRVVVGDDERLIAGSSGASKLDVLAASTTTNPKR